MLGALTPHRLPSPPECGTYRVGRVSKLNLNQRGGVRRKRKFHEMGEKILRGAKHEQDRATSTLPLRPTSSRPRGFARNLQGIEGFFARSRRGAGTRREAAFHSPSSSHQAVGPLRVSRTPIVLLFSAALLLCARSLLHGAPQPGETDVATPSRRQRAQSLDGRSRTFRGCLKRRCSTAPPVPLQSAH